MNYIFHESFPRIHTTPLAKVISSESKTFVELDDENEHRLRITFKPTQATRLITYDCFSLPDGLEIRSKNVIEVVDSPWIIELNKVLSSSDSSATFLDQSKHYLLPLQDNFLEVIAWEASYEYI